MINIYYAIWVDGLLKVKSIPKNEGMWKFYGIMFTSAAMAMNIVMIMTIIQSYILHISFYNIKMDIFPGTKLDALLNAFILFLAPPLILNYSLIFHKNRYEKLFNRYKSYNGKLYAAYLILSFFLPILLLVIAMVIDSI